MPFGVVELQNLPLFGDYILHRNKQRRRQTGKHTADSLIFEYRNAYVQIDFPYPKRSDVEVGQLFLLVDADVDVAVHLLFL